MNRMSWLLVVPLALVSALSVPAGCVEFDTYTYDSTPFVDGGGTGGNDAGDGGVGGTGGMSPQCTTQADCTDNECRTGGSCNAGTCEWAMMTMPGTLVGEQVYGDCKKWVCDESGNVVQVDDDADKYDWVPECYVDDCKAGEDPEPDLTVVCTTKWGKSGACDPVNFNCLECKTDVDCGGLSCATTIGKCLAAHCTNAVKDGNETDINCGGSCAPCEAGMGCAQASDCRNQGKCSGSVCAEASCNDGVTNGNETDTDCGGTCTEGTPPKRCGQGKGCLYPSDCATGNSCKSGICMP